jgi:hypothetical protein
MRSPKLQLESRVAKRGLAPSRKRWLAWDSGLPQLGPCPLFATGQSVGPLERGTGTAQDGFPREMAVCGHGASPHFQLAVARKVPEWNDSQQCLLRAPRCGHS